MQETCPFGLSFEAQVANSRRKVTSLSNEYCRERLIQMSSKDESRMLSGKAEVYTFSVYTQYYYVVLTAKSP